MGRWYFRDHQHEYSKISEWFIPVSHSSDLASDRNQGIGTHCSLPLLKCIGMDFQELSAEYIINSDAVGATQVSECSNMHSAASKTALPWCSADCI